MCPIFIMPQFFSAGRNPRDGARNRFVKLRHNRDSLGNPSAERALPIVTSFGGVGLHTAGQRLQGGHVISRTCLTPRGN